ncbi:thiamine-phosphate kinase [Thauera sp. CAU 1555]|uniref:Thiamine-monophosphate kinase n=1 Tax=Thauera sedimentorum TaxID=2767595 RepID=A0ABR9BES4_9RHOO|nr:thiamine-phosphate kinase [Thauera sedimentorum]MBC9072998.1 thiamine-phosphate kinase [Thauera sedimentorum]MBD8503917.1 thiamine-phosphate kinase [Thauera sedimentorum]
MPGEFDLIRRHFSRPAMHTALAGGDDAALVVPRPDMQLAVSTDMLVAGTHFFADTDPTDLGWKALAVNVSDLAAMGAEPRWAFLALALPAADDAWLAAFADGFYACAEAFGVDLAGGDTTRGPLNLCVTVVGEAPAGQAVTRAGARPGDELWVSGRPGRAALGLWALRDGLALSGEGRARCLAALHRPQPRVALGLALRGLASAMLDVSDGLIGDLGHILEGSRCGAQIETAALPLENLLDCGAPHDAALRALLSGGDDYELLFTATAARHADIAALADRLDLPLHCIGQLNDRPGEMLLRAADGSLQPPQMTGYDHFA